MYDQIYIHEYVYIHSHTIYILHLHDICCYICMGRIRIMLSYLCTHLTWIVPNLEVGHLQFLELNQLYMVDFQRNQVRDYQRIHVLPATSSLRSQDWSLDAKTYRR